MNSTIQITIGNEIHIVNTAQLARVLAHVGLAVDTQRRMRAARR